MATATTTVTSSDVGPSTLISLNPKSSQPTPTPIPLSTLDTTGKPPALESAPSSPTAILPKQRWNIPPSNIPRVGVCFFALFNLGINDASYGALLPFIGRYYSLSYLVVSLVFAAPFIGYAVASLLNHKIHLRLGQRGIAVLGPGTRIVAYLVLTFHPPYPAAVCVLAVAGFGIGIIDAAWNAWVGDLADSNQLLGLMHGAYGAGATVSPVVATAMVVSWGCDWWQYSYVPMALCVAEAAIGLWAFWTEGGGKFREVADTKEEGEKGGVSGALKQKVTWLVAAFLFVYVGAEVALGGWIVTFMTDVRNANAFDSGISATGFWLGITLGRVILGFITPRIGERLAVSVYLVAGIGLELLFWLVPNFIVSAVMVGLLGFFLGPLFPAAIVAATKLLPKHLHVSAIGFSASIGGGGAAILPFAVGAIAAAKGVKTLEPIVLALLALLLGIWLLLPRIPKHDHEE